MINYIPTLQSPLQGSNLPNVLKSLSGQSNSSSPINSQPPGAFGSSSSPINSQPPGAFGSSFDKGFTQGYGDGPPSSSFLGFDYNKFAPGSGLSGSDLAEAAQAGSQSGLTFDPGTGNVF